MNLDGNHLQSEYFRHQLGATEPLKKNLWKQVVEYKIQNQACLLKKLGKNYAGVESFARTVKSSDADNREGAAARMYWPLLMGEGFIRDRYGAWPNAALNYGYIVLRAAVARALAGSGLLATLGIHHHSRYNAFCLADDIMEPYRPYVDELVYELYQEIPQAEELTKDIKARLLELLSMDVHFEKVTRPLMVGLSQTTASLARCYSGESRKVEYPLLA
jgi:CRISPR-associated protein Cas1